MQLIRLHKFKIEVAVNIQYRIFIYLFIYLFGKKYFHITFDSSTLLFYIGHPKLKHKTGYEN